MDTWVLVGTGREMSSGKSGVHRGTNRHYMGGTE